LAKIIIKIQFTSQLFIIQTPIYYFVFIIKLLKQASYLMKIDTM